MCPPAHLMHWQKMKDCRVRYVRGLFVGTYVAKGDGASITGHQHVTEFVCCIHSSCWGMNGIDKRPKCEFSYFLGWHNSKDLPEITTSCSNYWTALSFPQDAFFCDTNILFVMSLQQRMLQIFLAEVSIDKRGPEINIMEKRTYHRDSSCLLNGQPHHGDSWWCVAIKTWSNKRSVCCRVIEETKERGAIGEICF